MHEDRRRGTVGPLPGGGDRCNFASAGVDPQPSISSFPACWDWSEHRCTRESLVDIWSSSGGNSMKLRLGALCASAFSIAVNSTAVAAPVSIVNGSFEDLSPGVVLGVRQWTCNPCFQAGGTVTPDPIVGWVVSGSGDAGTFRPSANEYPGAGSSGTPASGIPDGIHVAYSNGPDISQVLNEKLVADRTYVLNVDIGNRNDLPLPDFAIALLAGGNVLASIESTSLVSLPANGMFSTVSLSYSSATGDPLVGQSLEIQLVNNGASQMNFDNVTLDTIPLPASLYLFGSGILGLIGVSRMKKSSSRNLSRKSHQPAS